MRSTRTRFQVPGSRFQRRPVAAAPSPGPGTWDLEPSRRSPIALPHHEVETPEDRDDVREHRPLQRVREARDVHERRPADAQALRAARAVGDDVEAELALGVLGAEVALGRAELRALGHHHELVDELLHVRQHFALDWQRDLAVVDADRARRDLLERLLEDAARLLHLLDAAEIAVVRVARLADGHVEVVVLVAEVRALLAEVPLDAGRAETRTREAVADRDVARHHADVLQAVDPDAVRRQEALDVALDALRQVLDEALDAVDPAGREVARA